MICGPRSKDSPNQSHHSGKRKEIKGKHIKKEGLTGLRHLRKIEKNQVLRDQDSDSKKKSTAKSTLSSVDRAAAYPQLQAWEGLTWLEPCSHQTTSRSKKWVI